MFDYHYHLSKYALMSHINISYVKSIYIFLDSFIENFHFFNNWIFLQQQIKSGTMYCKIIDTSVY